MGPYKSEVKTPSPTLPARHVTQTHFFLVRHQKLDYQAVIWRPLYWSKFIAYVEVVEWGSQNCVLVVARSRGAPLFTPLPKIA